jgi:hypothetical protein
MGQKGKSLAFSRFAPEKFTKSLENVYVQLLKEKNIN